VAEDPLSSDIDKSLLKDKVKYSRKLNEMKAEARNEIKPVAYRTEETPPPPKARAPKQPSELPPTKKSDLASEVPPPEG